MGELLRFPARPLAAQRALADVEHALSANDFERSETIYEIQRLKARLHQAEEDLEGIEDDRKMLERERVRQLLRLAEEARSHG